MVAVSKLRWLRRVGITLAVLLVVGFVGYRFWEPGWRFDVRGVDVSHHQGSIDWVDLAADGTSFAYIKATEGADWTDSAFTENWQAAGDVGLLRGAYQFFTLCSPGADQAAHMIATVPDEIGMLPPAVDLEFGGDCSARPAVSEFLAELGVFLDMVEDHYRMQPVVYTNADFYSAYLDEQPPDVTWWVMSPVWQPWGSPEWTFWQHFPGYRAGVEGRVDRNVFRGTEDDLRVLTERYDS